MCCAAGLGTGHVVLGQCDGHDAVHLPLLHHHGHHCRLLPALPALDKAQRTPPLQGELLPGEEHTVCNKYEGGGGFCQVEHTVCNKYEGGSGGFCQVEHTVCNKYEGGGGRWWWYVVVAMMVVVVIVLTSLFSFGSIRKNDER